jgi:DnaD/phage-associated family protein
MVKRVFKGIPDRAEVTPIPDVFFTEAIAHIDDIAELKVVLHILWLWRRRKGYPRYITLTELKNDTVLINSIKHEGIEDSLDEVLEHGLNLAVKHGMLLSLTCGDDEKTEYIYLLNTEAEKKTVERIEKGELVLADMHLDSKDEHRVQLPDIYTLYEQNVGIITPLVADELQEAQDRYPPEWIESAFKEAIKLNKRSWKYIERILERWNVEGKDNGKPGRDIKKEKDPDRYIRGKYGHMVKR